MFGAGLLRPPGAVDEELFRVRCIRCGQCIAICPHNTLKQVRRFGWQRATPYFEPQETPCQLCMKCPPVCPSGALDSSVTEREQAHMGRAFIRKNSCYNYTGETMCMTCYDRCPLRGQAIVLADGFTPAVTTDCTGCGVCAYVCPARAISVVAKSAHWIPADAVPTLPLNGSAHSEKKS